jgi:chromosome segregation ATPase
MEQSLWSVWCNAFLSSFLADVAAGAVLLVAGYLLVERRLHLRERSERRKEAFERRQTTREAILRATHGELESNAALLQTALKELPTGGIPYPGFDVNGWSLVSQIAALTTLQRETIEALALAHNRMNSANEQLQFLSDLNHRRTAILTTAAAAPSLSEPKVQEAYEMFLDYRDTLRNGLIQRLKELKPHIDNAIGAVETELGMASTVIPSQRDYQPATPPGTLPLGSGK